MRYYLASNSAIKKQAFKLACGSIAIEDVDIDFGSLTSTPQPVGLEQAFECCAQRVALVRQSIDVCSGVCVVAIESFITQEDSADGLRWVDKTLVWFTSLHIGPHHYVVGPPCGVAIPQAFQPSVDTTRLERSIGSRIHEAHPTVPADDWYEFAGHEVGRVHDIARTIRKCHQMGELHPAISLDLERCLDERPMTVYQDYPTPGVQFADFFSVTCNGEFGSKFIKTFQSAVRENRIDVDKLCIVGLELRGVVLASMVHAAMSLPLVAARKPGKLPPPVESISYSKEYGMDTIEMKKDHVAGFQSAIVIDDVIATGGSMRAACELCERLGLEVALVVALVDIVPLRQQWQNALWKYNVCVLSHGPIADKVAELV
jgi:adenine phosphoribosyltransferase